MAVRPVSFTFLRLSKVSFLAQWCLSNSFMLWEECTCEPRFQLYHYFRFTSDTLCRWEFFTSLWFEWQIITGKRGYRWSIWASSTKSIHSLAANILLFSLAVIFWLSLVGPLCNHRSVYWVQYYNAYQL